MSIVRPGEPEDAQKGTQCVPYFFIAKPLDKFSK